MCRLIRNGDIDDQGKILRIALPVDTILIFPFFFFLIIFYKSIAGKI